MEIHLADILFQIINFGLLFAILTKFLYRPILKVIDERASKIKEGLDAAEKNIKLQSTTEIERNQIVKDAKKQAKKIVTDAQLQAEDIIKQARSKSKQEAKTAVEKERQTLTAQINRQKTQLVNDFSSLVTQATEAVLRGVTNQKVHQSIIDKQIKSLDTSLLK